MGATLPLFTNRLQLSERQISVLLAALDTYEEDTDDQIHQEREHQRQAEKQGRSRYSFHDHLDGRKADVAELRRLLLEAKP